MPILEHIGGCLFLVDFALRSWITTNVWRHRKWRPFLCLIIAEMPNISSMNSISINGAPTPNGHRVTTSIVLRLVNVCVAFIALVVSGSADTSFPLFACMGWFLSSLVLMFSERKEVQNEANNY